MVAMSPRQSDSAVNDNDLQRHIGFTVELSNQRGSSPSRHSKRAAAGLTGHVIAALALVSGILTLPLLQGLVVPATTASGSSSDIIRGSTIAPTLLESYEDP